MTAYAAARPSMHLAEAAGQPATGQKAACSFAPSPEVYVMCDSGCCSSSSRLQTVWNILGEHCNHMHGCNSFSFEHEDRLNITGLRFLQEREKFSLALLTDMVMPVRAYTATTSFPAASARSVPPATCCCCCGAGSSSCCWYCGTDRALPIRLTARLGCAVLSGSYAAKCTLCVPAGQNWPYAGTVQHKMQAVWCTGI